MNWMRARSTALIFLCAGFVACQSPNIKTVNRDRSASKPVVESATIVESEMKLAQTTEGADGGSESGAPIDTEPRPRPAKAVPAPGKGPTGALIAYQLSGDLGMVPGGGCRLKLENVKTNKATFVNLTKEHPAVFKELDPGRYFGTRLSCKTTKIWNLDNLFGMGFDVVKGRVSYVGKIQFEFTKTDLGTFKQASRLDSQAALRDATGALPIGAAEDLISGFTLKPITTSIIEAEGPESFDVFAKGTNDPNKTLEELMTQLKRCSINVTKDDPLRIGHLTYVAAYKAGAFAEMKDKADTHALSEEFTTCVDNSLRTFKPSAANELEVRVRY